MDNCFGYKDESGAYILEGFGIRLFGNTGKLEIVPQSVVWPHLGVASGNEITLTVRCVSGEFNGAITLEVPIGCMWVLESDLNALEAGNSSELVFPSPACVILHEAMVDCRIVLAASQFLLYCRIGDPGLDPAGNHVGRDSSWVSLSLSIPVLRESVVRASEQITQLYRHLASLTE